MTALLAHPPFIPTANCRSVVVCRRFVSSLAPAIRVGAWVGLGRRNLTSAGFIVYSETHLLESRDDGHPEPLGVAQLLHASGARHWTISRF